MKSLVLCDLKYDYFIYKSLIDACRNIIFHKDKNTD